MISLSSYLGDAINTRHNLSTKNKRVKNMGKHSDISDVLSDVISEIDDILRSDTDRYTGTLRFRILWARAVMDLVRAELDMPPAVSYTHLRAHETRHDLVCRLLL